MSCRSPSGIPRGPEPDVSALQGPKRASSSNLWSDLSHLIQVSTCFHQFSCFQLSIRCIISLRRAAQDGQLLPGARRRLADLFRQLRAPRAPQPCGAEAGPGELPHAARLLGGRGEHPRGVALWLWVCGALVAGEAAAVPRQLRLLLGPWRGAVRHRLHGRAEPSEHELCGRGALCAREPRGHGGLEGHGRWDIERKLIKIHRNRWKSCEKSRRIK